MRSTVRAAHDQHEHTSEPTVLETSTYYVTAPRLSLDGDEADWIVPLAAVPLDAVMRSKRRWK
jgi:hypothetical protein